MNNDGLCECGCGQPAPIAKRTVSARGRYLGQPMRFIRGHNSTGMDRSGPRKQQYREEDRGYETPCWVWQLKISNSGYGCATVKGKGRSAHRWYYEQANGPIPEGMQIDHLCRVRTCVNPDHLEVVTRLENMRRSRASKITLEQAREVYRRRMAGERARRIAADYGISVQTVYLIARLGPDAPRRA